MILTLTVDELTHQGFRTPVATRQTATIVTTLLYETGDGFLRHGVFVSFLRLQVERSVIRFLRDTAINHNPVVAFHPSISNHKDSLPSCPDYS
jgi:hypothetical protein